MFHKGIVGYSGHMQDSSQEKLFFHAFMHDFFFPFITFIPSSPNSPLFLSHPFYLSILSPFISLTGEQQWKTSALLCTILFCFHWSLHLLLVQASKHKCTGFSNSRYYSLLCECFITLFVLSFCYEILYLWCDKFLFLILYCWGWWLQFGQQGHHHHYYY